MRRVTVQEAGTRVLIRRSLYQTQQTTKALLGPCRSQRLCKIKKYKPESCCDELRSIGELVDHVGHRLPVHRVQGLVDLVKEVEWSRVTFLNINITVLEIGRGQELRKIRL